MTDERNDSRNDSHLPECVESMIPDFHNERWICICAALRACEQRVTERWEDLRGWGESYAYKTGSDNGFDVGYTAGLDAAREAVARVGVRKDTSYDMRILALAAIDALKKTNA